MSQRSGRKRDIVKRFLAAPFKRSRSRSPNPGEAGESDRKVERSTPAKSELDPPAATAASVSSGQSPSTSHPTNDQTPQIPISSGAAAIGKRSGTKSSRSENVIDDSHRGLGASSPGGFGRRSSTVSGDPSETTTIASDTRAAASHVSNVQSPSTSHTDARTPQIILSSDTTPINQHFGSTSSHSKKLGDGSHRKLEASPGEPDHRPVTISNDPSDQFATLDASDTRAAGSTLDVTNPYAVIMGNDPATTPSASSKVKSTLDMFLKGLKRTLEVVKESSDMMLPLKTAAGAILGIWNIVEVCLRLYSLPLLRANQISSRSKTKMI
jgi:hypothetical protein